MATKILMPPGGQTTNESLIAKWRVKEGDDVKRGDVLFEMETDKASLEVECFTNGTVLQICKHEGETAETGEVVAYVGAPSELPLQTQEDTGDDYRPIVQKQRVEQTSAPNQESVAMATPKARKRAAEQGIDISALFNELKRPVKASDLPGQGRDKAPARDYERVPVSAMRKTIASRMLESANNAPQYQVTIKPVMDEFLALRYHANALLKQDEVKLSINDMLAKAICIAVRKAPYINASFSHDEIRLYKNVNVGIAVALPDGLVVPVVKKAEEKTVREIAEESAALIEKAKTRRLQQSDMEGGTITISNLGMYGIDSFTAIVNRPESAILAVGAVVETPVCIDGAVKIKKVANITASFDHSLIDGGVAAMFMSELKQIIEKPLEMLLQ